jgi:hypothetical protein
VATTRVNPEAWDYALLAAEGDLRRLTVVDATTVIVLNGPAARH